MGDKARDVSIDHEPLQASSRGHDFALVIGIDHYPRHCSLQGAISDATAFHAWTCASDGGAVEQDHARLILSTAEPATPVQDQIDEQLVELMEAADRLGGGRRLYFYFSGHGAMSPGAASDDVALLLARWSKNLARIALSSLHYSGTLSSIGLFKELAIFLDCCRTATGHAVGLPPTITYETTTVRSPTRTFLAYATEAGRSAFERIQGPLWQGVFTRCLLQILRRSPHGIQARALKDQLECEMCEAQSGQQAHVVDGLLEGATFGRGGVLPALHVTLRHARGHVKLLDGRGEIVAECDAGEEPWQLAIRAGLYKLLDGSGATVLIDHGLSRVTHVEF